MIIRSYRQSKELRKAEVNFYNPVTMNARAKRSENKVVNAASPKMSAVDTTNKINIYR